MERKDRTKAELNEIICWLTGYDPAGLQRLIDEEKDMEAFINEDSAFESKTEAHQRCRLWGSCGGG